MGQSLEGVEPFPAPRLRVTRKGVSTRELSSDQSLYFGRANGYRPEKSTELFESLADLPYLSAVAGVFTSKGGVWRIAALSQHNSIRVAASAKPVEFSDSAEGWGLDLRIGDEFDWFPIAHRYATVWVEAHPEHPEFRFDLELLDPEPSASSVRPVPAGGTRVASMELGAKARAALTDRQYEVLRKFGNPWIRGEEPLWAATRQWVSQEMGYTISSEDEDDLVESDSEDEDGSAKDESKKKGARFNGVDGVVRRAIDRLDSAGVINKQSLAKANLPRPEERLTVLCQRLYEIGLLGPEPMPRDRTLTRPDVNPDVLGLPDGGARPG